MYLRFSPDHFVDDTGIGLDEFDYDVADVLADVNIDGGTVVTVAVHGDGGINGLQQRFLIDAGKNKSCIVERLRTFGGGADTDCREWMAYRCEET